MSRISLARGISILVAVPLAEIQRIIALFVVVVATESDGLLSLLGRILDFLSVLLIEVVVFVLVQINVSYHNTVGLDLIGKKCV